MKKNPGKKNPPHTKAAAPVSRPAKEKKAGPDLKSYRIYLEAFLIFILALITYGNSIQNDYNIDDAYVVSLDAGNTMTKQGIKAIPQILSTNYNSEEGATYGYRPLGKVTFAIEYSFWGSNPQYSHFVNILLFALNTFLLLLFIRKIAALLDYRDQPAIYLALLLFIVHPIHTEVVCSLKNREEILSFIFMLAALLSHMRWAETKKPVHAFLFAWWLLLGMLSKQTAVITIGIVFLIEILRWLKQEETAARLPRLLKKIMNRQLAVVIVIFLLAGYFVLQYIPSQLPGAQSGSNLETFEASPLRYFPSSHVFPNAVQTLFFYIKKLVIPFPLLFYYGYDMLPDRGWDSMFPYLGILLLAALVYLLVYVIRNKKPLFFSFWLLFFFLAILPFSNLRIFPLVTGIVGERLAYQASAGFCVLMALAFFVFAERLKIRSWPDSPVKTSTIAYCLSVVIVAPFLLICIQRNSHWKDSESLYRHDMPYLEKSARANYMMAGYLIGTLQKQGSPAENAAKLQQAQNYLYRALKVYPEYDEAWLGLGNMNATFFRNTDSALYFFSKVDTSNIILYSKVLEYTGDIYMNSSQPLKGISFYYSGLQKYSQNRRVFNKLTRALAGNKMSDSLVAVGNLGIKNGWVEGYMAKGQGYFDKGDTATAILFFQQAIDKGFRNPALLENMSRYYSAKGEWEKLNKLRTNE